MRLSFLLKFPGWFDRAWLPVVKLFFVWVGEYGYAGR